MNSPASILVVGGGAAGFFAAITAAEALVSAGRVTIVEATTQPLTKVRISGGGRCNVTNICAEPKEFVTYYPRGARELLGPLTRFGSPETIAWFASRGVELRAQADGRLFPVTDRSATVIDCLVGAARAAGVTIRTRCGVRALGRKPDGGFTAECSTGETLTADRVLLATGGGRDAGFGGCGLAAGLGHTINPPVPSLFGFRIHDPRLDGLAGIAFERAAVHLPGTSLRTKGPLLINHEGMSGPAVLKLSAWGARELAAREYRFTVAVNFVPEFNEKAAADQLSALRTTHGRKQLATWNPLGVPLRLWERLVTAAGARADATWAGTPSEIVRALARQATAAEFSVYGKSTNKDEFVTCGGVLLREVDFRTMESRVCPGLYFAGEVLDIDGLTGGFNFQAAWTTGWHAGHALANLA
jgi:hypothetical protein